MVIHAHLVKQIDRLPIHDSRIRRGEPGGVHKMRVTLRRLRSLLATFAPLFDADVVASLREELKWVAGELGGARDSEVVRKRLQAAATTPEERAVVDKIGSDLTGVHSEGVQRGLAALDSDRYSALLQALEDVTTAPPWSEDLRAAEALLRRRVLRDWKRLRRAVEDADGISDACTHQELLHEVRKAAKRLRYSAETMVPEYGEDARKLARGAQTIQTELGEVQDSVVAQGVLREMSRATGVRTEEVFALGGLDTQERLLSASAEIRYVREWAKLSRKKRRRWLA